MADSLEQVYQKKFLKPFRRMLLFFLFVTLASSAAQMALNFKSSFTEIAVELEDLQHQITAEVLVGNEQAVEDLLKDFSDHRLEVDVLSTDPKKFLAFPLPLEGISGKPYSALYLLISPYGFLVRNWIPLFLIIFSTVVAVFFIYIFQETTYTEVRRIFVEPIMELQLVSSRSQVVAPMKRFQVREYNDLHLAIVERFRLDEKLALSRVETERVKAVATMVNMIAHDVRKPFSLLKILLASLHNMRTPEDLQSYASMALPEVQRSIDTAEGLLQDVMQVSSTQISLQQESISVELLLHTVFTETFRGQTSSDVQLCYALEKNLTLNIDMHKIKRVFANIITNACQATDWKGVVWIHATGDNGRVRFAIGNSGSFIPEESIHKVFDTFFSSDKRGGTGLGLAIARKWVEAHGGIIYCRSERSTDFPAGMVEFIFDLPAAYDGRDATRPSLASHSSAYELALAMRPPSQ